MHRITSAKSEPLNRLPRGTSCHRSLAQLYPPHQEEGVRLQQPGALGGGGWWAHMVEVGKCVTVTQPGQVLRARAGLLPTLGLQELLFTQLGDKPQGDSNQIPTNSLCLSRHLQIMTNQVRLRQSPQEPMLAAAPYSVICHGRWSCFWHWGTPLIRWHLCLLLLGGGLLNIFNSLPLS